MQIIQPGARTRVLLLSLVLVTLSSCGSNNGGGYSTTGPGNTMELNSGDIPPGGAYEHRFTTAGTFAYHCIHHSPMTGSVTVNAGAADTLVQVTITSSTSPFPAASVKPGGRVVWTNANDMLHTVTSQ